MPIANYTTSVAAQRSIAEIQERLAKAGATAVLIDYIDGQPAAVSFAMPLGSTTLRFRLPAKPDGILRALKGSRVEPRYRTADHARKVAWRIVRDWVRAQLALVEAEQATLAEAMLPYAITGSGRTLYQELEAHPRMFQLGSGESGE